MKSTRRPRQKRLRPLYDALVASGVSVTRRGLPTFVCEDASGLFVVWVKKNPGSRMKPAQLELARALEAGGIRTFRADASGNLEPCRTR